MTFVCLATCRICFLNLLSANCDNSVSPKFADETEHSNLDGQSAAKQVTDPK